MPPSAPTDFFEPPMAAPLPPPPRVLDVTDRFILAVRHRLIPNHVSTFHRYSRLMASWQADELSEAQFTRLVVSTLRLHHHLLRLFDALLPAAVNISINNGVVRLRETDGNILLFGPRRRSRSADAASNRIRRRRQY